MILTRVRALALACLLACAPAMVLAQTQPAPTAKQGASTIPRDTTPTSIFVAPAGGGYGPGRVVAIDQGFPVECLAGCSSPVAFTPSGAASLTAGTSSTRVALPAGATVLLINNGAVDLYYKPGNSGVVATTSDFLLPAGRAIVIAAGVNTHVAGITASSTAQLSVTTGSGSPTISGGGGGGGGGGGAVTIADGADVTQGALADAACGSDNGTCTAAALAKRGNQRLSSIITVLGSPFQVGGSIGNTTFASTVADGANVALGDKDNLAATSGVGSYDAIQLLKGLLVAAQDTTPVATTVSTALPAGTANIGDVDVASIAAGNNNIGDVDVASLPATPAGTNHIGRIAPEPTATSGCTLTGTQSAASTNATNLKASAGALCGGHAINTTATIYYLRLYNLASAPTCSSATGFVATVPVPASTSGSGTIVDLGPFGAAFATGIGFCITGGGSSTDNTNAATGVYVNLAWR